MSNDQSLVDEKASNPVSASKDVSDTDPEWASENNLSESLVDKKDSNPVSASKDDSDTEWAAGESDGNTARKGHNFFFVCCDTRMATIIVNFLDLFLWFVGLVVAATPGGYISISATNYVTALFQVAFTAFSIYGAFKYLELWIGFTFLWDIYIVTYQITEAITFDWSNDVIIEDKSSSIAFLTMAIIWQFIVIYAQGAFFYELQKGIIKQETYTKIAPIQSIPVPESAGGSEQDSTGEASA